MWRRRSPFCCSERHAWDGEQGLSNFMLQPLLVYWSRLFCFSSHLSDDTESADNELNIRLAELII